MKKLPLLLAILLAGCSGMEAVHTPEHRTQVTVAKDYQTAYRLVLQYTQRCDNVAATGTLYPDNNSASVVSADHMAVLMTVDLFKVPEGTRMDIYVLRDWSRARLAKEFEEVVRSGKADICT